MVRIQVYIIMTINKSRFEEQADYLDDVNDMWTRLKWNFNIMESNKDGCLLIERQEIIPRHAAIQSSILAHSTLNNLRQRWAGCH